jgi:peptidoglycan/xylan/chitin deacetylase (PgdA/CDA1 family)
MNGMWRRGVAGLGLMALVLGQAGAEPAPVAVTFDDLPLQGRDGREVSDIFRINERLVEALEARDIPAVGFINERKLERSGRPEAALVGALKLWLEAGLELGNHTYSHPDLHRVSRQAFVVDVKRGERITRAMSEDHGSPYRYFRHPYLHTGRDIATRDAVRAFLAGHGYTVAPVTMDNSEWIFAAAYERAHGEGDSASKHRLGVAYIEYMIAKAEFFERNAVELFDRPIAQVLLVHANRLNADWFGELADELAGGGRAFVSLEAALADPAYDSADDWTGSGGISWLHRWALTRGMPKSFYAGEPEAPGWVTEFAGVASE